MSAPIRVPGYLVDELIGVGGGSDVWRGRVAATGDPVALKRVPLGDPERIRAAHGEAAMLATLDHPNLMRLHEVVSLRDAVVLVLDLAAAGSLAELIAARGRLTPGEVVAAIAPVAAALAYAHAAGVVHGDVSAGNVLLTDVGLPLLADLGVARVIGADDTPYSTPAYVDPLVARGGFPGPYSDVFMLAGVALHALTGEPTWPGTSVPDVLAAAADERLDVAARLAAGGVPAEVGAVLTTALALDPLHRGTAADLALELRHSAQPVAIGLTAGRHRVAPSTSGPAITTDPDRHTVLWAAPPGFARPPATDAEATAVPTGYPPPPEPSPALTWGARARPVARRPPPRPWWRRRRPRIGLVAAGLVAAAVLVVRPASSSREGPGPSGSGAVAEAPVRGGPVGSPPSGSGSARVVDPAVRAAAELARLDALRADAFARRDPTPLERVYASQVLRATDAALLRRLVPAGCGLQGVRTSYADLRVVASSGAALTVTVTARLGESRLVCGQADRARAPGTGPVTLRVDLRAAHDGTMRIAAQTVL